MLLPPALPCRDDRESLPGRMNIQELLEDLSRRDPVTEFPDDYVMVSGIRRKKVVGGRGPIDIDSRGHQESEIG